jgi:hypothetical protein
MSDWLRWITEYSEKYGTDPNFCLAVAEVESSKGKDRFRFSKVGRYWLPWGIDEDFEKRGWEVDTLKGQTEIAIRALSRHKNQRRSLKKYNASFTEAYYRRVKALEKRNRHSGIFGKGER